MGGLLRSTDPNSVIERVHFSTDGTELVAILSVQSTSSATTKVFIFSVTSFPKDEQQRDKPCKMKGTEIILDWGMYYPRGAAFSKSGTMIAIYTAPLGPNSGIGLLQKTDSGWELWGFKEVPLFQQENVFRYNLKFLGQWPNAYPGHDGIGPGSQGDQSDKC